MLGGAAVVVIVIALLAFLLNRGDDSDKPSAVATDPAAATVTTPSPTDSASTEAPTASDPTASATAPAPAKTSAPGPGTAVGSPTETAFARFAHPPTVDGGPGNTRATNEYSFPIDQIDPVSSKILVHLIGQGFRVSVPCSAPDPATRSCHAEWTAPSHKIAVSYYLTIDATDKAHYTSYTSETFSFNVP